MERKVKFYIRAKRLKEARGRVMEIMWDMMKDIMRGMMEDIYMLGEVARDKLMGTDTDVVHRKHGERYREGHGDSYGERYLEGHGDRYGERYREGHGERYGKRYLEGYCNIW